jgi:hypothetical protein
MQHLQSWFSATCDKKPALDAASAGPRASEKTLLAFARRTPLSVSQERPHACHFHYNPGRAQTLIFLQ